jgi:tRNA 2-selenouridine synthase
MLLQEYRHFVADPGLLAAQLDCLAAIHGRQQIAAWQALAAARDGDTLVRELLERHYDPAYTRSTLKHYPRHASGMRVEIDASSDAAFDEVAARCIAAG